MRRGIRNDGSRNNDPNQDQDRNDSDGQDGSGRRVQDLGMNRGRGLIHDLAERADRLGTVATILVTHHGLHRTGGHGTTGVPVANAAGRQGDQHPGDEKRSIESGQ
jgi:hypothetical protein